MSANDTVVADQTCQTNSGDHPTKRPVMETEPFLKSTPNEGAKGLKLEKENGAVECASESKEKKDPEENDHFPEGGYGWTVVAACFAAKVLVAIGFTYGLFFIPVLEQFGTSRTQTAAVGSLCTGCIFIAGPLSSLLCSLVGHRATCIIGSLLCCTGYLISAFSPNIIVLYFSYGILVGIGLNCFFVTSSVMPSFYFRKRRQFATGIGVAGTGFGLLTLPLLVQYSIDKYTWRGAMVIGAGVTLQGCVVGALFRPHEAGKATRTPARNSVLHLPKTDDMKAFLAFLKDSRFLLLFLIQYFFGAELSIYFTLFPDRIMLYDVSPEQAALLLSIGGVCSAVTRVLFSAILDATRMDYSVVFGCMSLLFSVPFMLLISESLSFGVLVIIAIIQGVCYGIGAVIETLRVIHIFGIEQMTSALGCILFAAGVANVTGTPFAAFLRDLTGGYKIPFLLPGISAIVNGLLHIPLYYLCKKRKNKGATSHVMPGSRQKEDRQQ